MLSDKSYSCLITELFLPWWSRTSMAEKKNIWGNFVFYPLGNRHPFRHFYTSQCAGGDSGPCRAGAHVNTWLGSRATSRIHLGVQSHVIPSSRYPRNTVIHFLHWDCGKPPGPVSWFVRRPWSYYLMADLTLLFSLQDGLCTATYFFCQGCWQPFPYYINLVYWLYLGTNIRKLNFLSQRKNKQHVDRSRSYFPG